MKTIDFTVLWHVVYQGYLCYLAIIICVSMEHSNRNRKMRIANYIEASSRKDIVEGWSYAIG